MLTTTTQTLGRGSRGLLACLVVLGALSACHSGSSSSRAVTAGPLEPELSPGTACHPKNGRSSFILGSELLTNTGEAPLTIDSIDVTGASNVAQAAAYVSTVPTNHSTLMGSLNGPPPEFYAKSQHGIWLNKVPAMGAEVPKASTKTSLNMLVVVTSPDPTTASSFKNLTVSYHDADHPYLWTGMIAYRLAPGSTC